MSVIYSDFALYTFDAAAGGKGDTVAYLLPNAELNHRHKNQVEARVIKDEQGGPRARDQGVIRNEVNISGTFLPTNASDLPDEHKQGLRDLFGQAEVSDQDQVNRLAYYLTKVGAPFILEDLDEGITYDVGWHNRAEAWGAEDENAYENGRYPMLWIRDVDTIDASRRLGEEYTIKAHTGFQSIEEA
ncbi:hypothetical protein BRD56_05455 [Thermoplasmatales archaeon SW_10_69_26]|nr:MAG: hypothetical protein BRD56_05455 [Thermoplasmatales archaeon SW_10_69_26]